MSHRLSTNITDRTWAILEDLSQREEITVTDLVNRSVQLYNFITSEMREGNQLKLAKGDEVFTVHIA